MGSTTSSRLWRIHKAAGRPFPQLVKDDVLDYLITEAVAIKVAHEDAEARKKAEREAERDRFKRESKEALRRQFN